jgi:DNA modification methylase
MVQLSAHEILPFQGELKSLMKEGYKKLKKEIIETGFAFPIHVWKDKKKFYTIGGHQRLRTIEQMKIEGYSFPNKIPCVQIFAKDFKEAKRRVLQDVSQYGKVQEDGLYDFMHDADFSIDEVKDQFDIPDVDLPHFESNFFDEPSKPVEGEDDVPEVKKTDIKLGDLFQLGDHRLLCGDATSKEDVERLMNGEKADMVYTDPPYGMNLDTDYSKLPSTKKSGNKSYKPVEGDSQEFNPSLILEWFKDCKEIIMFGADYYSRNLSGGSWYVWDKRVTENFDRMIGSAFELAWSKSKHKREIARFNNTLFSGESDAKNKVHPTQKPIKLHEWFFERISGELVVDLYLGSGSTLIACEKTKRKCFGSEIDPQYIQVVIDRWEKFTGNKATKLNGKEKEKSEGRRKKAS